MAHCSSTAAIDLPFAGELDQGRPSRDPSSPLIHILDDYSLLCIFSLSRPVILDKSEVNQEQLIEGGEWSLERWWYRLVQVCRRWRCIVFESASHLRLSLVCARGTPVTDMLAHSPPLPLIIDHLDLNYDITTEDEEGIILALRHRDRVRRIRLRKSVPILQKLVNALDGEFPILDYLYAMPQRYQRPILDQNTSLNLTLPETFRAPHLRCLLLMRFAIPIDSPLLATMGNLVTLSLNLIPPSAYFHPSALLQRVLLMPQLEGLGIFFNSHFPSRDIERQSLRTPIITRVILSNLRRLGFQGASAYLETLLSQVTIPLLEKLQVYFFNQLTYSISHLQQLVSSAENLQLKTATLSFREDYLAATAYPHEKAQAFALSVDLGGKHLDWQVASAAQVFHTLRTVSSAVEHLSLEYDRHTISSEWSNEADCTQWHELLGSFGNVKTLYVYSELVGQLSQALQHGEGESSAELLPELHELHELHNPDKLHDPDKLHNPDEPSYSAIDASHNAFASFIDARQKAGHPVTLIHS